MEYSPTGGDGADTVWKIVTIEAVHNRHDPHNRRYDAEVNDTGEKLVHSWPHLFRMPRGDVANDDFCTAVRLVNLFSEPVLTRDIVKRFFSDQEDQCQWEEPAKISWDPWGTYVDDVRSIHADLWPEEQRGPANPPGGAGGYRFTAEKVMDEIGVFLVAERQRRWDDEKKRKEARQQETPPTPSHAHDEL